MGQDLQQLDENHAISQVRLEGGYLISTAFQLVIHPVCEGSLLHRHPFFLGLPGLSFLWHVRLRLDVYKTFDSLYERHS